MPRKRKRRNRTAHAGVKLLQRERGGGLVQWLARWRDPATRKARELSLAPLGLTTEEARRAWAVSKARDIAREKAALASGTDLARNEPRTVPEAVEDFLDHCRERLRPWTVGTYTRDLGAFLRFCEAEGIDRLDRLTAPHLERFKRAVSGQKRTRPARKRRRGEKVPTAATRRPASVNRALRGAKTFLLTARRLGLLPRLDREAVTEGLKALREPRPRPAVLRTAELRKLLEAALRHDAATWTLTRAEHDGLKLAGTTARYEPVAPLVLAAVLTGCRISELLTLPWSCIHLNPPDKGELIVTTSASKTLEERAVTLEESPSLVRLLAALKLKARDEPYVFGGRKAMSRTAPEAARKRLVGTFGAPSWTWQRLRQTCAAYLVCAPGIYGAGAPYREALRLGHSVVVAEKHYVGLLRDIPREARTLEAAMGIEDLAERIVRAASGGTARPAIVAAEA